ncbi:unnamed protein product, partial [Scytosiphon promiscuus]
MSLRRRWRSKQRSSANGGGGSGGSRRPTGVASTEDDDAAAHEERMEFLAEKALGGSASSKDEKGRGVDAAAPSGLEALGLGATADFDGEELEMACRRLLDALWMSAKRGSDTLQLSVLDGRALLTGLLTGIAPPGPPEYDSDAGQMVQRDSPPSPLVDLGIPLPRALAALTAARAAGPAGSFASSSGYRQKQLRPVLPGREQPQRERSRVGWSVGGGGSTRSGSGARRREAAALQRAMALAMGVESEKSEAQRRLDRGRGLERRTSTGEDSTAGTGDGDKNPHSEWATSPFRPAPSDGRVQGRQLASRARVHRELRNAGESLGRSFGGSFGPG